MIKITLELSCPDTLGWRRILVMLDLNSGRGIHWSLTSVGRQESFAPKKRNRSRMLASEGEGIALSITRRARSVL